VTDELKRKIASAENMAVRQRNYRRARDRALARLAQAHRGEYLELLAKEKEADEQEGKRWHYHSNNDVDLWSLVTGKAGKSRRDTSDISQNESDNE
jgi:hypothetical protein